MGGVGGRGAPGPDGAYAECLLKARILTETPLRLLETLRWNAEEVREQVAKVLDLETAQGVFLVNSVRGWRQARLAGTRAL